MSSLLDATLVDPDLGEAAGAADPGESFLVFRVGQLWCAVPALEVKEVIPRGQPVPVPQTPGFVLGLVNVSGRVVVVLELGLLLGGGGQAAEPDPADAEAPARDLVLLSDGMLVGARVDEVAGLVDVARAQLQALPGAEGAATRTFALQERAVTVFSVPRLLELAEAKLGGS